MSEQIGGSSGDALCRPSRRQRVPADERQVLPDEESETICRLIDLGPCDVRVEPEQIETGIDDAVEIALEIGG